MKKRCHSKDCKHRKDKINCDKPSPAKSETTDDYKDSDDDSSISYTNNLSYYIYAGPNGNGMFTGKIIVSMGSITDRNYLLCDGASYSSLSYPSYVLKFGITSNKFNVPNFVGQVIVFTPT